MRIEKRTDIPAKNEGVCRMERLVRVDRFSRVVEDGLELGAKQRVGYFDFWRSFCRFQRCRSEFR